VTIDKEAAEARYGASSLGALIGYAPTELDWAGAPNVKPWAEITFRLKRNHGRSGWFIIASLALRSEEGKKSVNQRED
jgi:hypothetical protein